ncbi:MAG: methionine adenosyltransferase [Armatimonadetes bacterium]|nr:methionine adenosyltransferase [Armatimonadota bacterium]
MSLSRRYLFTSESVTEGHPDKVADRISDAVLDELLSQDPLSRVACETLCAAEFVIVAGEITSRGTLNVPSLVRHCLDDIGYTSEALGFVYPRGGVITALQRQSPDIAQGVDVGGAGDQGMMFGYATDETPELMPAPIVLAHNLSRKLAEARHTGQLPYLRPDGKSQATVEYEDGRPVRVDKVLLSSHHQAGISQAQIREDLINLVIRPTLPEAWLDDRTKILVNPTGSFEHGGPAADTGLTGRKIIVDTYGGMGRHGGGAFSGKDPTKVDRSAAYMMRYIAKNIVSAGLARRVEVQVAYAIGEREPMSVNVNTFSTGEVDEGILADLIPQVFELTPGGIIEHLDLRRPIYQKTAAYGHFGQAGPDFSWEATDKVGALKAAAS